MASQIPLHRSWWYYTWRWIALTAAFFIWVVIDWFDVLSRLFPTWREPAWMRATTEVGVVPMLGLIVSMTIATAVVVWIIRKENTQLREISKVDSVQQERTDPSARLLKIHDRLLHLSNTWEVGYPAGPEAWRTDVAKSYQDAEELIRAEYSAEEAAKFRALDMPDSELFKHESGLTGDREVTRREMLLLKKAKFVYRLAHGSS